MKSFTTILFLCSLISVSGFGQSIDYHLLAEAHTEVHQHTYAQAKKNKNEIEFLFSGLFLFYKNFFSSQDAATCNFTPSCSEYGILAIKKRGLLHGIFFTFDRLTRCHRMSPHKYEIEPDSQLLIDYP